MRLKNKKTGTIYSIEDIDLGNNADDIWLGMTQYKSLTELNEEWEDYEEPKELDYWYIEANGEILQCHKPKYINHLLDRQKEIGNYFETKEEAEKAVEKLKAWKRLKDKGFRFERWLLGGEYGNTITFSDYIECDDETRADLDLLFGSEE